MASSSVIEMIGFMNTRQDYNRDDDDDDDDDERHYILMCRTGPCSAAKESLEH